VSVKSNGDITSKSSAPALDIEPDSGRQARA
jgi:hypothetical protein